MTKEFDKIVNSLVKTFGKKETETGLDVEKEHDDVTHGNKTETAKIVRAHLEERPDYYKKLKKCVEN